jgi:hypothetical protein
MSYDMDNVDTITIVSQENGQESKVSIALGQTAVTIINMMLIVVINPSGQLDLTHTKKPIQMKAFLA